MNRNQILNINHAPNGLKDQLINAGIVAGFNFFSTLAGLGATRATQDPLVAVTAAAISAGLGFFATFMAQRGLKKSEG